MSTKTPCRAKNPSKCPYHGAPATIEAFHAALKTGRDLTSAEVQEYLEAADSVKQSQWRADRIKALLGAPKITHSGLVNEDYRPELPQDLRISLATEVKNITDEEELLAAADLIFADEADIEGALGGDVGSAFLKHPRLSTKNRIDLARRLGDGDAVVRAVLDDNDADRLRQLYEATKGGKGREPISTAADAYEAFLARPVPVDIKTDILETNPGYIHHYVDDKPWDAHAYAAADKIINSGEVGLVYKQYVHKNFGDPATAERTPASRIESKFLAEAPREVALKVADKWASQKMGSEKAYNMAHNFVSNPEVTFADVKARAASLYVGGEWVGQTLARKADTPEAVKAVLNKTIMAFIPNDIPAEEAEAARKTYRYTPKEERTWQIEAAFGRSYASWDESLKASHEEQLTGARVGSYWDQAVQLGARYTDNVKFQAALAAG